MSTVYKAGWLVKLTGYWGDGDGYLDTTFTVTDHGLAFYKEFIPFFTYGHARSIANEFDLSPEQIQEVNEILLPICQQYYPQLELEADDEADWLCEFLVDRDLTPGADYGLTYIITSFEIAKLETDIVFEDLLK